jgi:hypothetical protein
VSKADADVQRETTQYHIGPDGPVVRHFLTLDLKNPLLKPEPVTPH